MLARCRNPADAPARGATGCGESGHVGVHRAAEFSLRSRMHWLTKTKAGIALGYAALLGLLVGAVVTSQTLTRRRRRRCASTPCCGRWAFRAGGWR